MLTKSHRVGLPSAVFERQALHFRECLVQTGWTIGIHLVEPFRHVGAATGRHELLDRLGVEFATRHGQSAPRPDPDALAAHLVNKPGPSDELAEPRRTCKKALAKRAASNRLDRKKSSSQARRLHALALLFSFPLSFLLWRMLGLLLLFFLAFVFASSITHLSFSIILGNKVSLSALLATGHKSSHLKPPPRFRGERQEEPEALLTPSAASKRVYSTGWAGYNQSASGERAGP